MGCVVSRSSARSDVTELDKAQRYQEIERRRLASPNGIILSKEERKIYDEMKPEQERKLYDGVGAHAGISGV